MKATDLEMFRKIFADRRNHIGLAIITQLSLVDDRSALKVLCKVLDDSDVEREIVARMTWEAVGPESGFYAFPSAGDLVLIAYAEGLIDQAFVIKRLSSLSDKIPLRATEGHSVLKALAGKQTWITGSKVNLTSGDDVPTENVPLGQVLKTLLLDLLTKVSDLSQKVASHGHTGNLGYPTSPPDTAAEFLALQADFDALKESPVEDEAILSDVAFTEKGSGE